MTSRMIFQSLTWLAVMGVTFALWFGVRYAIEAVRIRHVQRAHDNDWDRIIASIKLRLPRNAEFAVLEHQIWFSDDRNRQAAKAIFVQNGFDASEAETYEEGTKYWLLAWRSAVFSNVRTEIGKVAGFAQSYGGRYAGLGLRAEPGETRAGKKLE
ncbi:MAG: hypothetical protein WA814_11630 [Candidatus Baltobacteraceae bacterium]